MGWKSKIRYFIDYYLKFVILFLLLALFLGSFVKSIMFDRKDVVLSVMILSDPGEIDIDLLEEALGPVLGIVSEKQDISFSMLDARVPANEPVIWTRLRARSVDVLITDEEAFDAYARQGVYRDLSGVLSSDDLQEWESRLLFQRIEETDDDGRVLAEGESLPYGVALGANRKYRSAGGRLENPVIGIVSNTEHAEEAQKAVEYFLSE
ncbi:MAG: hypothetical protein ACOYBE_02155 [Blautia sp.]